MGISLRPTMTDCKARSAPARLLPRGRAMPMLPPRLDSTRLAKGAFMRRLVNSRAATAALALSLFTFLGQAGLRVEIVTGGGDVHPVSSAPMGKVAVKRGVQGPAG